MTQTDRFDLQTLEIHLADISEEMAHQWRAAFKGCEQVHVTCGILFRVQGVDALVSPANSFGYMDGGIDLRISEHFGWELETRVRTCLLEEHDGELPVGQAIVVPTNHDTTRWLISAPTMRVPMKVEKTTNAYLAFRAVLRVIREHNTKGVEAPIRSVVCSGLGTGEGRMPAKRCARQMRYAYDVCVRGELLRKGGLAEAARNHMDLIDYEY